MDLVEEETYGLVESFGYLGDVLVASGGEDLTVRAHVRSPRKKFHELEPFLAWYTLHASGPARHTGQRPGLYTLTTRECFRGW